MPNECTDDSTKYLANIGFNVCQYATKELRPLEVLGRRVPKDDNNPFTPTPAPERAEMLGPLGKFFTNTAKTLPVVTADQEASDVNGQKTSNLGIDVGFSILGTFIKAMGGGDLGASEQFTKAKGLTFSYTGVFVDSIDPIDLGKYLEDNPYDATNPVIDEYTHDRDSTDSKASSAGTSGELLAVTRIIKSDEFTVNFVDELGNETKVDIPKIAGIISGGVSVTSKNANDSAVHFKGPAKLSFGFQCFKLVPTSNGMFVVQRVTPGMVDAFVQGRPTGGPIILAGGSLVSLKRRPLAVLAHQ